MRLVHVGNAAVGVAVFLGVLVGILAIFQRSLLYFPDPQRYKPSDVYLNKVREVVLDTPDGERLIAWHLPAAPGKPTFLYFHGNGGGLLTRSERFKYFEHLGYGLFMQSYRGYSGSTGKTSEQAMFADARLAYDYLRGQGLGPRDIAVYGESLGTGVAVHLATERDVASVVLDAPYTSMVDMGRLRYPFLPVNWLLLDRFDSLASIGKLRAPLLVMHGEADNVIPLTMGKTIFAAAPEPKVLEVIPGAGHSNIFTFGALARLQHFVEAYLPR